MTTSPSTPGAHPDGRVARGERTRRSILDAHAQLIREGVLRPTGAAVAARAGVSVRSLWANFKDIEGLMEAATSEWVGADSISEEAIDPLLPRSERVARFCGHRARRLEVLAPATRSSAVEPASPAVRQGRAVLTRRLDAAVRALFAPEIVAAGPAAQEVVTALVVSCCARSWIVMRDDLGLDPEAAEGVMRRTFGAVLEGAAPTSGP